MLPQHCRLSIVASALLPQHCRLSMNTVADARFHPRTSSIVPRLHRYHLYYVLCFQSGDATIVAVLSMPVSVQCATDVAVVSIVSSCSMLL